MKSKIIIKCVIGIGIEWIHSILILHRFYHRLRWFHNTCRSSCIMIMFITTNCIIHININIFLQICRLLLVFLIFYKCILIYIWIYWLLHSGLNGIICVGCGDCFARLDLCSSIGANASIEFHISDLVVLLLLDLMIFGVKIDKPVLGSLFLYESITPYKSLINNC
eukprot:326661_1